MLWRSDYATAKLNSAMVQAHPMMNAGVRQPSGLATDVIDIGDLRMERARRHAPSAT